MEKNRFRCALTITGEPACETYARVTILDAEGGRARGCPRHAVAALEGTRGARVDWPDTKGLNEFETAALKIAEERSQLAALGQPQLVTKLRQDKDIRRSGQP